MKDETRNYYDGVIRRSVSRIVLGLDGALELGALAASAGLSPLHFHHVFRGLTGETPLEMHRRLRLERAASRLADGDAPITTIAFEAGYETHESFTRAFGAAYGSSPTEMRSRARASRAPGGPSFMFELAARCGVHFTGRPGLALAPSLATEGSPMHVDIESLPERRVAAVRHRGPYNTISSAFARLDAIARASGLTGTASLLVALYHDDPEAVPPAELRADAGLVIPEGAAIPAGLTEIRIPAGSYARTTHTGPYNLLGDAWARFMGAWLARSGRRLGSGPAYECYLNTPMTAAPADLRTDLYVSLAEEG